MLRGVPGGTAGVSRQRGRLHLYPRAARISPQGLERAASGGDRPAGIDPARRRLKRKRTKRNGRRAGVGNDGRNPYNRNNDGRERPETRRYAATARHPGGAARRRIPTKPPLRPAPPLLRPAGQRGQAHTGRQVRPHARREALLPTAPEKGIRRRVVHQGTPAAFRGILRGHRPGRSGGVRERPPATYPRRGTQETDRRTTRLGSPAVRHNGLRTAPVRPEETGNAKAVLHLFHISRHRPAHAGGLPPEFLSGDQKAGRRREVHPSLLSDGPAQRGGKDRGLRGTGRARADGSSSYEDYAQGSNMDEGVWIASPAGTPLAEAKHVYWFESAFDAMAYYQLHRDRNRELDKAVFVSTSNFPSTKQMRGVLEQTIPARQHICFNSSTAWHDSAWKLEREIYCTVRDAIEQTPERKPYLDSIPDGQDLTEGEYYLLPKGGLQESCKWFDSEWEEAMSMRSSRLCAPEDVQDQIDTMNRCYREYREKLREFLGIDREHDVDFTREEPDYRHKSWNGQLLAEQRREESVGQRQEREESAEEERQTRLGR